MGALTHFIDGDRRLWSKYYNKYIPYILVWFESIMAVTYDTANDVPDIILIITFNHFWIEQQYSKV